MPPKKDSNTHNNSASSNNTITTNATTETSATNTTNNAAGNATTPSTTTCLSAVAAAAAAAASSALPNSSTTNTTAANHQQQPVVMADAAAEQRTVAYQANAKLCRLVRKCPWMYDRNHHNYAKKHILDKSWCKIAKECSDSVASCKERWRNIRAAFARSINIYKTHSGPNRVKPYYLHKELSFLVKPMMEGRDKNDDSQETSEGGTKEEYTEEEEEEEEPEDEEPQPAAGEEEEELHDDAADIKSAFEALNPDISIHTEAKFQKMLKNYNNTIINSSQKSQNHNNAEYDASSSIFEPQTEFSTSDAEHDFHFPEHDTLSQTEAERRVAHMMSQKNATKRPMHLETEQFETKRFKLTQVPPSAAEADISFLEALLPDMALMNTRQKIVFKKKIYQTLEEVFENSNDFPNLNNTNLDQHNPHPPPVGGHLSSGHNFSSTNMPGGTQVKQTVLTVNSSTARSLINNIANLSETELQKVNGFLQNSLRSVHNSHNNNNNNGTTTTRMTNGGPTSTAMPPSSAAARLMHSTPKITITKVTCPPPASLRNMAMNKPPSPSTGTVSTTIHHTPGPVMTSNVHSTTSSTMGNPTTSTNNANVNSSPWSQLLPIAIKDEVEDVDID